MSQAGADEQQIEEVPTEISLRQSSASTVSARRVEMQQSAARSIDAEEVRVAQGGVGIIRAVSTSIEQGGVGAIVADKVDASNTVSVFLLARSVEGNTKTVFNTRGALAFGIGLGIAWALLRWLRGLLRII